MTRFILGILFGLTLVIVVAGINERLGMALYPMPLSIDWAEQAARAHQPWSSPSGARG